MTASSTPIYGAYDATELDHLRRENETLRARLAFFERTSLPPLTPVQLRMFRYLRDFLAVREYAPSHEEIALYMGYQSLATVHEHLKQLEAKGYIRRVYNEVRSIRLSPAAEGMK